MSQTDKIKVDALLWGAFLYIVLESVMRMGKR